MRGLCLKRLIMAGYLMCMAGSALAHPLAPGLLEITHKEASTFSVLWRLSAVQMKGIAPQPMLPEQCSPSTDLAIEREPGLAVASRWEMQCDTPSLGGERISIQGLERNPINVVVRIHTAEGDLLQTLLDGNNQTYLIPTESSSGLIFVRYLALGIEHLAFGPDHLLFLLALILIVGMNKTLIWTLTAFTIGHSITLTLASLEVITANPALMEFGIALSLIVAARELLRKSASILGRKPAWMAAGFGLLHGMGFAGALQDIGLPRNDLLPALLAFNIGIELAQLAIALLLFVLILFIRKTTDIQNADSLKTVPAYLIGALAAMWCIERSFAVLI